MKIKPKQILTGVMAVMLLCIPVMGVYASDGEEYITITVEAADDNEGMTYAVDSDDPGSFGPSNTFTIPAGTAHTIYVKDAAGNITSQVYEPPELESEAETSATEAAIAGDYEDSADEESSSSDTTDSNFYDDVNATGTYDGQTIDIDLELGRGESDDDEKPYEIKRSTPAEQGEGTVYSKTFLDGTDSSEQVFYSITTADGNVFYLLIDQGQESNNTYLLNQVTDQDLRSLAADSSTGVSPDKESDSLLKALSESGSGSENTDVTRTASKGGVNKNAIIMLVIMALGGGLYYYQKVYKAKKEQEMDAMDAPDMDQFVTPEEEGEGEDFDFEYGDDDKDQYIRDLILEDEAEYAAAADSEAEITGWDDTSEEPEIIKAGEPVEDIFHDAENIFDDEDIFRDEEVKYRSIEDIFHDYSGTDEYDPDLDGEEKE